jgi:hypothetical protein
MNTVMEFLLLFQFNLILRHILRDRNTVTLSQASRHGPRRGDQTGAKCSNNCKINTKARSLSSIADLHNSDLYCPRSVPNLASISGKKSFEGSVYLVYFQVKFIALFLLLSLCQCMYLFCHRLSSSNDFFSEDFLMLSNHLILSFSRLNQVSSLLAVDEIVCQFILLKSLTTQECM